LSIRDSKDQSWPVFLGLLDSDPRRAWEGFYRFVQSFVAVQPPPELVSIPESDRKDLVEDVVVYCVDNDFRVLRRYHDTGHEFAGWFYVLVKRRALDWWRRSGRESGRMDRPGDIDAPRPELPSGIVDNPEHRERFGRLVECVSGLMEKLGGYCRLLLALAAEEYTPREMVAVLRWNESKNKKVSDDLRYCRRRLKEMMARESDIDVDSMFEN
jgi:DNA-directed RNA polymerase specialized sigma24 family protein